MSPSDLLDHHVTIINDLSYMDWMVTAEFIILYAFVFTFMLLVHAFKKFF